MLRQFYYIEFATLKHLLETFNKIIILLTIVKEMHSIHNWTVATSDELLRSFSILPIKLTTKVLGFSNIIFMYPVINKLQWNVKNTNIVNEEKDWKTWMATNKQISLYF